MNLLIRSAFALTIIVIVAAACATATGAPDAESPTPSEPVTSPTAEPTVAPTQAPSEAPAQPNQPREPADEDREVAGTITVADGMTFSGPGSTIQEALDTAYDGDEPILVNGVIFRDTDGTIYLATAVSDTDAPSFDGPMLEVLNAPNDGPSWDMANAELLGLEEANGIIFSQDVQILGYLEIR